MTAVRRDPLGGKGSIGKGIRPGAAQACDWKYGSHVAAATWVRVSHIDL